MTCEECIAELATGSLRELTPDSPIMSHCARCPDCAQLTTLLRDREYQAASVLNNLPPRSNPITVAETAGLLSRRRRVGGLVVMASGAALVITIWIAAAVTVIPRMNGAEADGRNAMRTETIPLTCLSPQQAADIINPYVRGRRSMYWIPSTGISAITVQGNASELARSRDLIREFEKDPAAECRMTPAQKMTLLRDRQSGMAGESKSSGALAGKASASPKGAGSSGIPPATRK